MFVIVNLAFIILGDISAFAFGLVRKLTRSFLLVNLFKSDIRIMQEQEWKSS